MRRFHLVSILLILFFGIAGYSNTFRNSFVYDDVYVIVQNPYIRSLSQLGKLYEYNRARFVPMFSFALNYQLSGLSPWSYHVVNLLIHLGAAVSVYWLVSLLSGGVNSFIPLFTALLFVSHPIQTQAVTYVTQRMTSMAAMFFLLSLCFFVIYVRHASKKSILSLVLASLMGLFAYFSKENAFILPMVCLLVSFYFGYFKKEYRKRLIVGLFTLTVITGISFYLTRLLPGGSGAANLESLESFATGKQLHTSEFVLTQPSVISHYLRLLFHPFGQNIDYDFPIQTTFNTLSVIVPLLILFVLFISGILMYRKNKLISFGILFFFLTILPESSFIPIYDVIMEHRIYLPSIGILLAISTNLLSITNHLKVNQTIKLSIIFLVVSILTFITYQRNMVWQNNISLYADIVEKSPNKGKPHANLGAAYLMENRLDEALWESEKALSLQFHYAYVYNNIGVINQRKGNIESALTYFQKSLQIEPGYPNAGNNLAVLYLNAGNLKDAQTILLDVLKHHPDDSSAHHLLGVVLFEMGQKEEGIMQIQRALELDPNNMEIKGNLEKMRK